jgi:hypothetical protein
VSASPVGLARCRATAPNIWPESRCIEETGHGRVHQSEDGVWWIGDEPEPATLIAQPDNADTGARE